MAEYAKECHKLFQEVRSVSEAHIEHPSAIRDPQPDFQPVAFCTVGARYCEPLP